MANLVLRELDMDFIVLTQMQVQCMGHLADGLLGHRLQTLCRCLGGQLVKFVEFGLRGVRRPERKSHIDQLLRVQVTMPVLSGAPRSRQGGTRGVDRLPLVAQVDTPCDLFD